MTRVLPNSFVSFLDSLSFDSNGSSSVLVELWPDMPSVTAEGDKFVKPSVRLYQRGEPQVTLAGFRKKLLETLRNANHVATEAIADAILGCAVGAASTGIARAAFLEDVLTRFRKVEVSHFFVLPNSAIMKPVHFDGYYLGEINLPVLVSRCQRARSDYAELYGEQLRGRFALQSPDFKHVVIDFLKPGFDTRLLANNQWRELLLIYFTSLSRSHFEFMWMHLNRTQMLCAPFNAGFLDIQNLRDEAGKFAQRITIYLGFSRTDGGYVTPEGGSVILNQPGPDSESFARFMKHRATYRVSEIGDSELGRTLIACAGFCQQSIRFLEADRADDAALYATICLEHLFSDRKSPTDAVCRRTAALTFLRMAKDYFETERELRKLYDARSAFVHSGKSVTPAQAERLIAYARETLRSLLVLHFKPENRSAGFLEKWVKNLDFILSGFMAGRTFEDSILAEGGIFSGEVPPAMR